MKRKLLVPVPHPRSQGTVQCANGTREGRQGYTYLPPGDAPASPYKKLPVPDPQHRSQGTEQCALL